MSIYSDYVVFADESGDHSLEKINPEFPVFSLLFCVFRKDVYATCIEPAVRQFKFDYFGHDAVILHEREIRKQEGDFEFLLGDRERRNAFYAGLSGLVEACDVQLFASIIDKVRLKQRYIDAWNPYQVAMQFCMEGLCDMLRAQGQADKRVHVIFESRGATEDEALKEEFEHVVANKRRWGYRAVDFGYCSFEPLFVPKSANMAGHQLADLMARPLALSVLRPDQENRAMDVIQKKQLRKKAFPA